MRFWGRGGKSGALLAKLMRAGNRFGGCPQLNWKIFFLPGCYGLGTTRTQSSPYLNQTFRGLVVDASLTTSSTSSLLHSPNFQFGEILDLKESNYF